MIKILIAVPTFENIEPDCFKSIYDLNVPDGVECTFEFIRGYDCARARNMIMARALDGGFEYVLMVDSDTILPPNALMELLVSTPGDIRVGWQPRKIPGSGQTEIFTDDGLPNYHDISNLSMDKIAAMTVPFKIKGCGMGCVLVKCDALLKISDRKWFSFVEYDNGSFLSEDLYFCEAAHVAGLEIYCNPFVRCGHIGKIVF